MPDVPAARILIADDEPLFLRTTAELLRRAGYECTCAADGTAALDALAHEPFDLVLSDLNMPGNLQLELLREGRDKWPEVPLIVVTGVPTLPSAIESVRLGIADYLLKPVKYDDLLSSVRRALAQRKAHHQKATPSGDADPETISGLLGESQPMLELREVIFRVARTDANVLITGESGTGKEVVAQAIHTHSYRGDGPLQIIDCTAIPEALFESVLFGHAKGSFTGAVRDQEGLLSQSSGGTAFFDEIGELPPQLQAKLLRVIQEQTFTPLGKTSPVKVDTRFVCATNRDLEMEVNAGRFRRDLFYRLAVIHIQVPALRERGSDVLLLANHFLHTLQRTPVRVSGLSADAEAILRRYDWPGNIRELRNAIEYGLAMATTELLTAADLPELVRRGNQVAPHAARESAAGTRSEARQEVEREYLTEVLRRNSGNVAASAREAGMSRQGLHKLLKKLGLDAQEFRP